MLSTLVVSCLSATPALPTPPPVVSIRSALASIASCENRAEAPPQLADTFELTPWNDVPSLDLSGRTLQLQDDTDDTPSLPTFGAEGSTRWTITGGLGIDTGNTSNTEYGLGVGIQWFLVDDFAFAPALNLWGFSQEGENAFGVGLDLMFQWHFVKGESWSVYGDFGCGLLGTNHNVPSGGSQFNFTPQAGLGVTFDVGQDCRWLVGVRWHHISNASLYQNNPGRDSVLVYTGLSLPF